MLSLERMYAYVRSGEWWGSQEVMESIREFYQDPVELSAFVDLDALFLDENIIIDVMRGNDLGVPISDETLDVSPETHLDMMSEARRYDIMVDILYQDDLQEKYTYDRGWVDSKLEDMRRREFFNMFSPVGRDVALPDAEDIDEADRLRRQGRLEDARIAHYAREHGNVAVVTYDTDFLDILPDAGYDVLAVTPEQVKTAFRMLNDGQSSEEVVTLFDAFPEYDFDHPVGTNLLDRFDLDTAHDIATHYDSDTLPASSDEALKHILSTFPAEHDDYSWDKFDHDAVNSLYSVARFIRDERVRPSMQHDDGSYPSIDGQLYQTMPSEDTVDTEGVLLDYDIVEDLFLLRGRHKPFEGISIGPTTMYQALDDIITAQDDDTCTTYILDDTADKLQDDYGDAGQAFYNRLTDICDELSAEHAITQEGAVLSTLQQYDLSLVTSNGDYFDTGRELSQPITTPDDYHTALQTFNS